MTEHLSTAQLNAVVDGELAPAELARAGAHLSACLACTSQALSLGLLKRRVAEAGSAYALPDAFKDRMRGVISRPEPGHASRLRWMSIAAVVAICLALIPVQQILLRRSEQAAVVNQLLDQHIATLAAGTPPQVLSSDRHTVKPWFQGKLPFSFNLPASLPTGAALDGANLAYLHGRPAAQLLFSLGRHRASVFLQQPGARPGPSSMERAGFHLTQFHTAELEAIGITDADPAALEQLMTALRNAQ